MRMRFPVEDLITTLTQNRNRHLETYEQAYDAYQEKMQDEAKKAAKEAEKFFLRLAKRAKQGAEIQHRHRQLIHTVDLEAPVSHVDDYNRALEMLHRTSDANIELDDHNFSRYVLDEWPWQQEFTANTSSYLLGKSK